MSTRQIVEDFLKRMGSGDTASVAQLFAEPVDWHIAGSPHLPWLGTRSTRTEIEQYFPTLFANLSVVESSITKILVDGNDAVLFGRTKDRSLKTGKIFEMPFALHLTVENGLIIRYHFYEDSYSVAVSCNVAAPIAPAE